MTEHEIEELLGAYALDAVDANERAEIEAHLATCPRCRSEVAAHREVVALLANGGFAAPEGLWDRIAGELAPDLPDHASDARRLISRLPRSSRVARGRVSVLVGAVAAMAFAIALLSVQVGNLSGQVHASGRSPSGIAAAVNAVLSHQHRTIVLTSADHKLAGTVVLGADGNAYWIHSNLARLPSSKTYQLWTVVHGKSIVSLGVLGPNAQVTTAFRLQPDMRSLLVSVEPEGGTPAPTTPVVMSATV